MPALDTPWSRYVDVSVAVLAPGGGWSNIQCSVKSIRIAGGSSEWNAGVVDPSTMSAVLTNIDGSVQDMSGWGIRVSTGNRLFTGRIEFAERSLEPNGMSAVTLRAVDLMKDLTTTFIDDRREIYDAWDKTKAYTKGDRVSHGDRVWLAWKDSPANGVNTEPTVANSQAHGYWGYIDESSLKVGVGDTPKERLNRILDMAGWPVADRFISDALDWRLAGTLFGGSAIDLIHQLAKSIGAVVFLNRSGHIEMKYLHESTSPTWTVSAERNPTGTGPFVCASSFKVNTDMSLIVNYVHLNYEGGLSWTTTQDTASQSKYGVRAFVAGDFISLNNLSDIATSILSHSKEPKERLREVVIPIVDAESGSLVHSFEIGDSVSLQYRHESPDWGFAHSEGFIIRWVLYLESGGGAITLSTGHPLDTRPSVTTEGSSVASGGSSGGGSVGLPGPPGPAGPRGTMWFEGSGGPSNAHAPSGGFIVGDVYLQTGPPGDPKEGHIFVHTQTGWHEEAGVSLKGPQGPPGTAVTVLGTVPTVGDLPDPLGANPPSDGDVHFVVDTGDLMIFEHLPTDPSGGKWHDMGHVAGPPGPVGPRGSVDFASADNRYVKKHGDTMLGDLHIGPHLLYIGSGTNEWGARVEADGRLRWFRHNIEYLSLSKTGLLSTKSVTVDGTIHFKNTADRHQKVSGHYTSGNEHSAPWVVVSGSQPVPGPNDGPGCLWIWV